MKNLRVLCWAWIVLSTIVILFHAPVSVTYRYSPQDNTVAKTEWIGPFRSPRDSDYVNSYGSRKAVKSSLDFSRLVVAILAVNLVPAVLLGQHDKVAGWLEAQQRHRMTLEQSPNNEMLDRARIRREPAAHRVLISCVICLLAICLFLVGVLIHNQQSMPTAARKSPADEWKEVRRAIPVTR